MSEADRGEGWGGWGRRGGGFLPVWRRFRVGGRGRAEGGEWRRRGEREGGREREVGGWGYWEEDGGGGRGGGGVGVGKKKGERGTDGRRRNGEARDKVLACLQVFVLPPKKDAIFPGRDVKLTHSPR